MPDGNQNPLNPQPANLPQAPQAPFRPAPPAPPPPEITIRTMKSDIESLKQSGGAGPVPKTFTPPPSPAETGFGGQRPSVPPAPAAPATTVAPPTPPRPAMPKITPSEFAAPKAPVPPVPAAPIKPTISVIEEEKRSGAKKVLAWAGVLVVALVVGLLGYFYVFPILFPEAPLPPPLPAVTVPTPTPAPEIPTVETVPVKKPHQSLLAKSDSFASVELSAADLNSLTAALKAETAKNPAAGTLNELALSDANGQLPTSLLLAALIPELSADALNNLFEEDFTAALYADADGVWPAYILKLKAEASQVEAQGEISKLESSLNLKNLFLSDPGTPNPAGFRNGQANGISTRYLTYAQKGAGLNIAWSGDKLVISASYNGLKNILSNLAK